LNLASLDTKESKFSFIDVDGNIFLKEGNKDKLALQARSALNGDKNAFSFKGKL
jgi:hypothetical protein